MKIISYIGAIGSGKTYTARYKAYELRKKGYRVKLYEEPVDSNFYLGTSDVESIQKYYHDYRLKFWEDLDTDNYDYLIEDASIYQDMHYIKNQDFEVEYMDKYDHIKSYYEAHEWSHVLVNVPTHKNMLQIAERGREFEFGITEEDINRQYGHLVDVLEDNKVNYTVHVKGDDIEQIHGDKPLDIDMQLVTVDEVNQSCNKYMVVAQLREVGNGFRHSATSVKLGDGSVCGRKLMYGSDSSEYRNSSVCDSIHAEVNLLSNISFKEFTKCTLNITAHPCYQCAKFIVLWNKNNHHSIVEVHYQGPYVDKETAELFKTNNIDLIHHSGDDRKDY